MHRSRITPRRPDWWTEFLSWPAGASLLYLVSAACLLGGVGLVLAPGAGLEDRLAERLAMTGTVALYTGALLGVAALVCHWQRDHEDAVALSVLLAVFLVAGAAPLTVLALPAPVLVGVLGAGVLLLDALVVLGWTRRVGGPLPRALLIGGGLLLLGAVGAPGLVGLGTALAGRPDPQGLMAWWQAALGLVCAGMAALVVGLHRAPQVSAWPQVPRLLGLPLRWVLALVVGLVAVAQVWLASYAASLGLGLAEVLVPLVLAGLAADALAARQLGMEAGERTFAWTLAGLVLLVLLREGVADPWTTPLAHPALAALVGALGLAWNAVRARHLGLATVALGWAVLAVAGAGTWEDAPGLHLRPAGALLLAGLVVLAVRQRSPVLALVAVAITTLGAHLAWHPGAGVVLTLLGGQLLALHLYFRSALPGPAVVVAATTLAAGLALLLHDAHAPFWLTSLLTLLAGVPGAWWDRARLRHLTPLAMPAVGQLAAVAWRQPAWSAVALAFLLLAVGALLSRRHTTPDRGTSGS